MLAAAALAPLVLRSVLIGTKLGWPWVGDVGGLLSDLAVAAAFAALLIATSRWSRSVPALLLAFWGLLHYASYENVLALDALASAGDVRFLGDETFLRGSALWISSPVMLAVVVLGGGALGWLLAPRTGGRLRAAGGVALIALALFGVHALWMIGRLPVGWRYADFVQVNASRAIAAVLNPDEQTASSAMTERLPELLADLDGQPIVSLGHQGRNVLLIFIEGLSGGYLPDNVEAHRTFVGPKLRRLQQIAHRGLSYQTFIAHQRRTNRGLYAGLCGELPNLLRGTPKMTAYLDGGTRVCLPQLLRDAGYHTVYLQAAPLAFMLKDQFMPRVGFDEVLGHDWFETAYVRSVWGIDDRSYFEQSLAMVDRLGSEKRPWFLTLLTVGTHHPTIVPEDYEPKKPTPFARAVSYADRAIDAFIVELERRGVLDNTLVLITSDESRGISARRDKTTAALTQNWGFLVALLPDKERGVVREPFGLVDIPISILDYLGIAEAGEHLFGRSVFRSYESGRYLFFGNTNLKIVGALTPDGSLVFCPSNLVDCRRYSLPGGRLFGSERTERVFDPEQRDLVREVARRSVRVQRGGVKPQVYELLMTPDFTVHEMTAALIHGGQYVDLKKNQWLDVEIEFDASGGADPVKFAHWVRVAGGKKRHFKVDVRPGESLKLRYTYLAPWNLRGVRCRSFARLTSPTEMRLHFRTARMTVRSVGQRPEPGIVVQQREVVSTSTLR